MQTRGEARKRGSRRKLLIVSISIVVLLFVALGAGYWYSRAHSQPLERIARDSSDNSAKVQRSSAIVSSSTSSAKTATNTYDLTGYAFEITPILFNGQDVAAAMDSGKAPQNLIHDGVMLGYFKDAHTARVSGLPGYFFVHSEVYSADGQYINFSNWQIPYSIKNGNLQTKTWIDTDNDGNQITWQLKNYPQARTEVEQHVDKSSTSNSDGGVDQLNLTSEQLEHWVRSVIKQGSQNYDADDYSFTQSFNDGYAEIEEFAAPTGKRELMATFRVNAKGELEVKNDNTNNNWQVISKEYF